MYSAATSDVPLGHKKILRTIAAALNGTIRTDLGSQNKKRYEIRIKKWPVPNSFSKTKLFWRNII